jgi:membrane complex biogenesis BtpA family protein
MGEVIETAVTDAAILVEAGFPALIVENWGDAPFHAGSVPPETVAAMTLAAQTVGGQGVPFGVNVLRNDPLSALGIAAVTGAALIRVNVLTGVMYTDQGVITGQAAEVMRSRPALCPDVEVWADVMVKHATPPPGLDAGQSAEDTVHRGLADAVIVSGSGTGAEPDLAEAKMIADAVPGTRVVVGSGASPDNLATMLSVADSVIVGSHIKLDGTADNRPDRSRCSAFVEAAAAKGML